LRTGPRAVSHAVPAIVVDERTLLQIAGSVEDVLHRSEDFLTCVQALEDRGVRCDYLKFERSPWSNRRGDPAGNVGSCSLRKAVWEIDPEGRLSLSCSVT
jgi:hypothetical protein